MTISSEETSGACVGDALPVTPSPQADASLSILGPRYRAATIGMVVLVALGAFEALAVATAMPTVALELDGLRLYALAFGGTLATSVIGMTLAGSWSDRRGPGLALYAGLACFVLGLLVAGLAHQMPTLIVGRLLQGLGAGAYSVALYVIVGRLYPEALRPRMFAAFSTGWIVPSLVGPALSGLIVEHVGWRWVFLSVPLLAIPAGWLLRPTLRGLAGTPSQAQNHRRVYWAIGSATGILLLYLGGQQRALDALLWLVPGLALLLLCTWRLLPEGTLRLGRGLSSVIVLRGLAAAAFFGCEAFLPLLLSQHRGLSPWHAGVALGIGALGWCSGSWYQGNHTRAWSRAGLVVTGASLMVVGIAGSALVLTTQPVSLAIVAWAVTGLGMGLVYPSLSVLTLALSPPGQQGRNTSALHLSEAIAVATTLAVSGSLFAFLLTQSERTAYMACFIAPIGLVLLSVLVARRVQEAR